MCCSRLATRLRFLWFSALTRVNRLLSGVVRSGVRNHTGGLMDELRRLVESYGCLYHITLDERWNRIRHDGFDPKVALKLNGDMYKNTPFAGAGLIVSQFPAISAARSR